MFVCFALFGLVLFVCCFSLLDESNNRESTPKELVTCMRQSLIVLSCISLLGQCVVSAVTSIHLFRFPCVYK